MLCDISLLVSVFRSVKILRLNLSDCNVASTFLVIEDCNVAISLSSCQFPCHRILLLPLNCSVRDLKFLPAFFSRFSSRQISEIRRSKATVGWFRVGPSSAAAPRPDLRR